MNAFPVEQLRRLPVPAVIGVLVVILVLSMVGFGSGGPGTGAEDRSPAGGSTPSTSAETEPPPPPPALPASWPKRMTLYTDSVGLGAVSALREVMGVWRVKVMGEPALMVDAAAKDLATSGDQVDKVVVVALGYNSLWKHNREDFDYFSKRFDQHARKLVRAIRAAGGRKIVWVLLRDAPRPVIPRDALDQHRMYAWYFPYVNQRLRKLSRERSDVVLADWSALGDKRGVTYDAIHLNTEGALRYARMIRRAITEAPYLPFDPKAGQEVEPTATATP